MLISVRGGAVMLRQPPNKLGSLLLDINTVRL